jgi:hypothetical protein
MVDNEGELRVALRDAGEQVRLTGGEKYDRNAGPLGRRPEPVRSPVRKPCGLLASDIQPNTEHTRLFSPCRKAASRCRIVEHNAAHYDEAAGISFHRFLSIVEPVAFQGRRNDDDAINTRIIHHGNQSLDGEWFWKLRPCTGNPRAVWG